MRAGRNGYRDEVQGTRREGDWRDGTTGSIDSGIEREQERSEGMKGGGTEMKEKGEGYGKKK